MKHFLALPALLRAPLLLASASQHAFSVHDDLRAFPQYDVTFTDAYIDEHQAHALLNPNHHPAPAPAAADDAAHEAQQLAQYRPDPTPPTPSPKRDHPQLTHEYMLLNSRRYLCSIPLVAAPPAAANATPTATPADDARELARATDRGWALLADMQGNCVYYISGWWSYRFCYGQGVKQFHQLPPARGVPGYPPVEDTSVVGFELGNYVSATAARKGVAGEAKGAGGGGETDGKGGWDGHSGVDVSGAGGEAKARPSGQGELVRRGESRYLVQHLSGGTKCDLTGKHRRTEVQFHCNPLASDRIALIKETSTCAYLVVIQTPRLCNDVAFLPPQKAEPNPISCAPVLAEAEVDAYARDNRAARAADEERHDVLAHIRFDPSSTTTTPQQQQRTVGDIILGAHTLVPQGKVLPKGAIVGGSGKETYVDTVASSDGAVLSAEQLEALGVGDALAVEGLRRRLEGLAGGREWRLEVVEGVGGREWRGVIGEEGEGEGEVVGGETVGGETVGGETVGEKKGKGGVGAKDKEEVGGEVERDGEEEQDGSQEEFLAREEL
ncbi:hypothetical protein LTR08_008638 [Meristemomyces frigidus]|nr:hypothetical protein LTR08_008638 [Meristemomyces frigidus]